MELEKKEEKKKSQGRKKIPIERIAKTNQRQVTFSKRRVGIFKKGSELCTLCGLDLVIGVFSPAGKPFTFGHPWPEHVLKRYFNNETNNATSLVLSPQEEQQLQQLQQQIDQQQKREKELLDQLEMEKKMKRLHHRHNKASGEGTFDGKFWWEEPIEEGLGVEALEHMRVEMVKVRDEVVRRLHKMRHSEIVEGTQESTSAMVSQFVQESTAVPPVLPTHHCSALVPHSFGF